MKITEENFIQQLNNGNEHALEYVMKQYGGLVKSVVHRHLYHLIQYEEDCINEVFWAVWKNISRYQAEMNSFANWIAGIARLKSLDYVRKHNKYLKAVSIEEQAVDIADTSQEISTIYEEQLSVEIEQMLECLKEQDRELFLRLYIEDESLEEVSREMGMAKTVLYNRLSRAKKKIRKLYGKDGCNARGNL